VPIDPNSITSDMTLEIDDQSVTMNEFATAVDHFLGLVKEVSKTTAPGKNPAAWFVDVYRSSVGIGVRAESNVFSADEIATIRTTVTAGLRELERGKRPANLSDRAIEHSKALASLRNGKTATVRVWHGQTDPVTISSQVRLTAETIMAPTYEEDSSVEGFLERLNAHDKNEFVIYDTLTKRGITCYVDATSLDALATSGVLRKRVEVIGRVRYREDGQPVSVRVHSIVPFPDAADIPDLNEMRELLKGA
jgi:hypothetical protein